MHFDSYIGYDFAHEESSSLENESNGTSEYGQQDGSDNLKSSFAVHLYSSMVSCTRKFCRDPSVFLSVVQFVWKEGRKTMRTFERSPSLLPKRSQNAP